MLFNSLAFLYFIVSLVVLGFISPAKWMRYILLAASIFFYTYWYPPYLVLLLVSVWIDYFACIKIEDDSKNKKAWMLFAVVSNLVILFGFKYVHFAASIVGINLPENFHWALPLGISFFTFQTMACSIDVYRGEVKAKRNFADFLYYICFFPQLIAGPILRLKDDWDHLMDAQKPNMSRINQGLYLIFWGLVKKMLIADNLAGLVENCFKNPSLIENPLVAWLGIYAFAIQIYCDFSGYVDSAIGVAKIFGIELPANFNFPYMSQSITEFWRRWHITLSLWLRDYLYIPLGGNRNGQIRTYINLMLTMLLGGLWHGANWTFVVWGGLHGLYLGVERIIKNAQRVISNESEKSQEQPLGFLASLGMTVLTFHLTCLAWIFFRAVDFENAMAYLKKLFELENFSLNLTPQASQLIYLMLLAWLIHVLNYKLDIKNKIAGWRIEFRLIFILLSIVLILLFGVKQEVRFIYFDF